MTDRIPYQLPDPATLAAAVDRVFSDEEEGSPRLARVMCTVAAAAVRDILTGYDHDRPFDAAGLALDLYPSGSVRAPGCYWTAAGEEKRLAAGWSQVDAQGAVFDLNEWVMQLSRENRAGWEPLCERVSTETDGTVRYRLDLARAAVLPGPDEPLPDAGGQAAAHGSAAEAGGFDLHALLAEAEADNTPVISLLLAEADGSEGPVVRAVARRAGVLHTCSHGLDHLPDEVPPCGQCGVHGFPVSDAGGRALAPGAAEAEGEAIAARAKAAEEIVNSLTGGLPATYPGALTPEDTATVLYALERVIAGGEVSAELAEDAWDLLRKMRAALTSAR